MRAAGMYQHMENLLVKMQHTEGALDDRLAHLEAQMREQLEALRAEHHSAAGRWMLPFIGLCACAMLLLLWGVKQFQRINKLNKAL